MAHIGNPTMYADLAYSIPALWDRKLRHGATRKSFWAKFTGKEGSGMPIIRKDDLTKVYRLGPSFVEPWVSVLRALHALTRWMRGGVSSGAYQWPCPWRARHFFVGMGFSPVYGVVSISNLLAPCPVPSRVVHHQHTGHGGAICSG